MSLTRVTENTMKSFIFLFHLTVVLQYLRTISAVGRAGQLGNETDHAALLAIKSRLLVDHDAAGVLSSWNDSLHHCSWEGVTCGLKHSRVIVLDLSSRGLVGTISPYIGNLSFLTDVELYNNSLVGRIPPELGRLLRLQVLGLFNNTLEGEIPANLSACANLWKLSLERNKLEGKLPIEFVKLSKLTILSFHANRLTGPLFKAIANLTSLETISATDNHFTGSIPTSIGMMRNLHTLVAVENELTGTIPTSILNCSMLESLGFGGNKLHGELPPDIGLRLPRLLFLNLYSNQFSGAFPSSIVNLTHFKYLDVNRNNLVGRIPRDFGYLRNLQVLALNHNPLKGDINFIDSLVNCTKLKAIELSFNNFTGVLPKSIANLSTSLQIFLSDYNGIIGGELPSGITNLINLEMLSLSGNELTGTIPRDLGRLQNLEMLFLDTNRLKGKIPDTFQNLSRLGRLYLHDNQLEGSIPSSLGSCKYLLYFDLSSNHLSGTLIDNLFNGSAKFISVSLDDNLLQATVPEAISMQSNLVQFTVSKNKLLGAIPEGLGKCSNLQSLDMHGNAFSGYIPPSFVSLRSLQVVDLSENNLSGTIPSYFSQFPLSFLNLSYNDFEGKVPTTGVFANKSAIALVGNKNLCGGILELRLQKCEQNKGRKTPRTLRITIPLICAVVGVLGSIVMLLFFFLAWRRKKSVPFSFGLVEEAIMKVSYDMLLKATNGFSSANIVGVGNFGSVFRGTLNGDTVAVKVLNLQTQGASKSFMAECKALRNVRHRNLVGIVTACASIDYQRNDFKALVYEFMSNGNLDAWLHGDKAEKLTFLQRVDIAIDVAHALSYIHHDCEIPILHCDLKPTNILLDDNMVARVGDFGLSRFVFDPQRLNQSSSSSVGVRGTVGYVAPEYGVANEPTKEGDLYSYGILVLELMTGKRPTDNVFKDAYSLHMYAEAALPDNVLQIIDPILVDNYEIIEEFDDINAGQVTDQRQVDCMVSVISVGVACSKHLPRDRMMISEALSVLQTARDKLCYGKKGT